MATAVQKQQFWMIKMFVNIWLLLFRVFFFYFCSWKSIFEIEGKSSLDAYLEGKTRRKKVYNKQKIDLFLLLDFDWIEGKKWREAWVFLFSCFFLLCNKQRRQRWIFECKINKINNKIQDVSVSLPPSFWEREKNLIEDWITAHSLAFDYTIEGSK